MLARRYIRSKQPLKEAEKRDTRQKVSTIKRTSKQGRKQTGVQPSKQIRKKLGWQVVNEAKK